MVVVQRKVKEDGKDQHVHVLHMYTGNSMALVCMWYACVYFSIQ